MSDRLFGPGMICGRVAGVRNGFWLVGGMCPLLWVTMAVGAVGSKEVGRSAAPVQV